MTGSVSGVGIGQQLSMSDAERWRTEAVVRASEDVIAMIGRAAGAESDVFVDGTRQMATVWEDLSEVQRVLEVVEREAMVLNILARAPGTSIQIGSELPVPDVDMAVVSTTYESGVTSGSVGVIGPMRMNYRRVISAVEEVSRELEDRIQS